MYVDIRGVVNWILVLMNRLGDTGKEGETRGETGCILIQFTNGDWDWAGFHF